MQRLGAVAIVGLVAACGFGNSSTSSETSDGGDATTGGTTSDVPDECGAADANSFVEDGVCYCVPGTTWVNPFDPHSFVCAQLEPRPAPTCDEAHGVSVGNGLCRCADLYTWCVFDPAYEMPTEETVFDVSCCLDPAQDPDLGGTTTGDATTTGETTTGETTTGESSGSSGASSSSDTSTGA